MMRPGGLLRLHDLIYDFQPSQAVEMLDRWLEGAADDPALGYTRADFVEHIRTEHSTFRWLLEPMLEAVGFEIVTAEFPGGDLRGLHLRQAVGRMSPVSEGVSS